MDLPFYEKKINNYYIRKFSENVDSDELKWHRDKEDRIVVPVKENNWFFQRENQLPESINKEIRIKANEWHRVIKGTGDLTIKVFKL